MYRIANAGNKTRHSSYISKELSPTKKIVYTRFYKRAAILVHYFRSQCYSFRQKCTVTPVTLMFTAPALLVYVYVHSRVNDVKQL